MNNVYLKRDCDIIRYSMITKTLIRETDLLALSLINCFIYIKYHIFFSITYLLCDRQINDTRVMKLSP